MEVTSINKWKYYNIDRVQEILETNKKAIVILSGASSSGKSYCAKVLQQALSEENLNSVIISTDSYNKGISGIITDKVNNNYFYGKLENVDEIKHIIKDCIINTDFNEKFNDNNLKIIKTKIRNLINKKDIDLFLKSLQKEFSIINFDEPSVYDLLQTAKDINKIIENKTIKEKKYSKIISEQQDSNIYIEGDKIDVIIVEGIYALDDCLIKNIPSSSIVSNFVESDAKTLFLRRVLRDAKITSCDNCFTISAYFKYIVPSYINTILINKQKATFILKNNMNFSEIRSGTLYNTKEKIRVTNSNLIKNLLKFGKIVSKEKQRDIYFCGQDENDTKQNLLRLRTIYDENKKEYLPTSLVHKGAIKSRSDNKIIRPVNILIKEGDFYKIFNDENDFINSMKNASFKIDGEVIKTRIRLKIKNQELIIDDIKNQGIYIEFSNENDLELIDKIKKYAQTKKIEIKPQSITNTNENIINNRQK